MGESSIATDSTLIDYLRLATFNAIDYYNVVAAIERTWHEWRPAKWLQYKGRKSACGIFHGLGNQNKRAHGVISVSGQMSHTFYEWWVRKDKSLTSSFYCTRIDLQRTQEQPAKEYRRSAYKRLRGAKSLIESNTGMTLYIGARTSDKYWRIYDKTESLLRLEVELKGRLSKRAYLALVAGESISGVWNRLLTRTRVPSVYATYFRADGEPGEIPDLDEPVDLDSKLDWLQSLDALVYKLASDHDTAERTGVLIRRWAEYCDNYDNFDKNQKND